MTLLAIDGNSILNRAFYGIRMLTSSKGVPTNALFGFFNIYLKEAAQVQPDGVAVAFDLRSPTFRHKAVASYKANRKGMPEELAQQLAPVKELLRGMGVTVLEAEGFEADDILGTLARICTEHGEDCVILTGDRDSLQLVGEHVRVDLATNKETIPYTEERFREEYGFAPVHLIDLKALMGDSSDNIKGVPGIGPKTATGLIQTYGTIEELYAHLDEAGLTKGAYAKLSGGKTSAEESKWLATIVKDAPIPQDPAAYRLKEPDKESVSALLTELELFKLLDKLKLEAAPVQSKPEPDAPVISLCKAVQPLDRSMLDGLTDREQPVDFLLRADTLYIHMGTCICTTREQGLILAFLASGCKKRSFDAKPVYRYAFAADSGLTGLCFDGAIAAYLHEATKASYEIPALCRSFHLPYEEDMGDTADIAALPGLCDALANKLEAEGLTRLMEEIELPLVEVLASMEHTGVLVDQDGVRRFGDALSGEIRQLEEEIYTLAGKQFNIASPKQLGQVLFEDLEIPHPQGKKKTKTGSFSTNAEVLEKLRGAYPIVSLILRYRQLTKLNSTYVAGLLKTVAPDGRIHTCFKQTETRTGRISSTEPNMQNIPVRTELGKEMRKFFVAPRGRILLDADYSQIELRILANLCEDANMQQAFLSGADIHASTAAQVFGVPREAVTPQMRSAAKAVNFGIIYGIGAYSLSQDIGVSVREADRYIKRYLENFPRVEQFMTRIVEDAERTGFVSTLFGRRREVPELKSHNKIQQAAGRRIAMNTPIQGTAADIIKIAMIRVYRRLAREQLDARLILQVHDELIVEAAVQDADRAAVILREEMEHAWDMAVPLTAEVGKGESWYAAKG
ncbi:DNA polymerase I [Ruminococcus champanellensis]|uniref:DNA polymerase I n=1 Tax=Ruminococcus champanellensis TaxID=1161942 RepID=UPI0023F2193C|nr:DNA polymerase I [Ruminococcus champanellensis]